MCSFLSHTQVATPIPSLLVGFDPAPSVAGAIAVTGRIAFVIIDAPRHGAGIARVIFFLAHRVLAIFTAV